MSIAFFCYALIFFSDMYYKLRSKVLFREFKEYGYLTDNSLFGYSFLNDVSWNIGEKYLLGTGSIFLQVLKKTPRHIDDIVNELFSFFIDVSYEDLKRDAIGFYDELCNDGFVSRGITAKECTENDSVFDKKNIPADPLNCASGCNYDFLGKEIVLKGLHIEITNECNERCVHCYIPHKFKNKTIDSGLFYRVIEEARELNVLNITLSGGEPLIHKDIISFLRRCRELDFSVNILSNLTLLNDGILNELKLNSNASVQVSLYSIDDRIHDSITKVNGSLKKTMASIVRLVESKIPVQIVCPLMQQNKDVFYDVADWGGQMNLPVFVDYMIFGDYSHSGDNLINRLTLSDVEKAIDLQCKKNVFFLNNIKCKIEESKLLTENSPVCSICRYYLCVSASGEAFPCAGWQNYKLGNLYTDTLKNIWNNSKEINYLRNIKRKDFPKCIKCKDKDFCTLCMMKNCNEDSSNDKFKLNVFNCKMSSLLHKKYDLLTGSKKDN